MKLKNVPNILSCIRIFLVFVFVWLFFTDYPNNLAYAVLVFLIAGLTDIVDGFIARRFQCISNLGKVLDPFADKLMQCTVMLCFMIKGLIPVWFGIPFILKEIFILMAGLFLYKSSNVLAVSKWYGKFAVCFFYATIASIVMFGDFFAQNMVYLYALCGVALLITIGALIFYLVSYAKVGRENIKKESTQPQR